MPNQQLSKTRIKVSKNLLMVGVPLLILAAFFKLPLVGLSCFLCVLGVLIGKNRLVCPSCGKQQYAIGVEISRCNSCGADYFEMNPDHESKA